MFHFRDLTVAALALCAFTSVRASADTFELTLTNGSEMPVSGGALYSITGEDGVDQYGNAPSQGLINLCQMGDPTAKISELSHNSQVKTVVQVPGPILPGQKASVSITVPHSEGQSLHFVAMYGESKELCSVVAIDSDRVQHLKHQHVDSVVGGDSVLSAGAALEPTVSTDPNVCQGATNAISCLRALAPARTTGSQIHAFAGYLPSLINFLESRYGASDVLSLLLPSTGAVSYKLTRTEN